MANSGSSGEGAMIRQAISAISMTYGDTPGSNMTMRYAHPTPENKRHAVEVLAAIFGHFREKEVRIQKEMSQHISWEFDQ